MTQGNEASHIFGGEHPHTTIRASAGSGKTYQLSTRYLSLVRQGADVGSILATTFTRKAAGEVLGRVITRLADAAVDPAKRAELSDALQGNPLTESDCRAMLRTLTQALHRLSISTIDGFFNRIAQSFGYELDLPPRPVLLDEKHPAAKQLRLDAIEAMLADEDLPALVTLLRQLHHDSSARSVTAAIDDVVTGIYEVYREAPDKHLWSKLKPLRTLDDEGLQAAIQALTETAGALPEHKNWRKAFEANRDAAMAQDWERFINVGLTKKLIAGEDSFYNKPISEPFVGAFEPLIGHAAGVLIQRVALQTLATFDLLERFDRHYTELRRRQGILFFSDLTHKLAYELPTLGDGLLEDIYFRLDAQVTHLLLDEFQDTSPAQWSVLRPFAHEIAATSDGTRRFLCVGDTKQAIYGWRGGVAELFDQMEDELSLGEQSKQTLSTSYRSSGVVLDTVNEVFQGIADNETLGKYAQTAARWERGFQTHQPARDLPGYVTLETSTAGFNPQEDSHEDNDGEQITVGGAHERYTAQRVKELTQRRGGAGSIGVLVSTNAAAARLIHELGLIGVNCSGEGGSRISDSPAVSAVLSALVLADHPGDTASAFHVLNSPINASIGLGSLAATDVRSASLSIRRSLLSKGYAQTIADWTTKAAGDCDTAGLNRLTQLIGLAERAEPVDLLRPSRFVALAESARVAEPSQAAVRVMTIHGAKGLEFDTVVLAELDHLLKDRSVILVKRDSPTGPVTGVYRNANESIRELNEQLKDAATQQRATRLMDDLCALYVAMTRAKQALHMIVKPRKQTKAGRPSKPGFHFASILRSALSDVEETFDGEQVLYEHGDRDWVCAGGKQETVEAQAPELLKISLPTNPCGLRRSWPTLRPSAKSGGDRSAVDLLNLGSQDILAMSYGTLIHAWFERVGFIDEDDLPGDGELQEIAGYLLADADPGWVSSRIQWFSQLLASPTAKALLSRGGASELWCERGFAVYDGGRMLRGVFDRVMVTRDSAGRATGAVVLDYKTDKSEPGDEQEVAVSYRAQMLAYRRALAKMLKLDPASVKLKLWLVGSDQVIDVLDS